MPYVKEGLEAIIFTADGDMRQALNNLQATHFGFGLVDAAAVFKACLQPCLLWKLAESLFPHSVTCQDLHVPSPYAAEESGIRMTLCCLHACFAVMCVSHRIMH